MGRKFRGPAPIWGESADRRLTQSYVGRGLPPYQVASEVIQPFGHNRHGPKIGGCANSGDGSWVPIQHNVAGMRPTCTRGFILIRPNVWPQYTNVTDRTGRTDRRTGQTGQTAVREHRANRYTKGRTKTSAALHESATKSVHL